MPLLLLGQAGICRQGVLGNMAQLSRLGVWAQPDLIWQKPSPDYILDWRLVWFIIPQAPLTRQSLQAGPTENGLRFHRSYKSFYGGRNAGMENVSTE